MIVLVYESLPFNQMILLIMHMHVMHVHNLVVSFVYGSTFLHKQSIFHSFLTLCTDISSNCFSSMDICTLCEYPYIRSTWHTDTVVWGPSHLLSVTVWSKCNIAPILDTTRLLPLKAATVSVQTNIPCTSHCPRA